MFLKHVDVEAAVPGGNLRPQAGLLLLGLWGLIAALPMNAVGKPGDLDPHFSRDGVIIPPLGDRFSRAVELAVLSDGRIAAVGYTSGTSFPQDESLVVRLLQNGELDESFGDNGVLRTRFGFERAGLVDVVIASEGRLLVAGTGMSGGTRRGFVARLLPDGSPDASFSDDGIALTEPSQLTPLIGLQADGSIVVGGGEPDEPIVTRLDASGRPDTLFAGDGTRELPPGFVGDLEVDATSRIVVGRYMRNPDDYFDPHFFVDRMLPDGSTDLSFGSEGTAQPCMEATRGSAAGTAIALIRSGGVGVAAFVSHPAFGFSSGGVTSTLQVLTAEGQCGTAPVTTGQESGFAATQDENLVVSGSEDAGRNYGGPDPGLFTMERLLPQGGVDPSFGDKSEVRVNVTDGYDALEAVAAQPDGQILAAGRVGSNRDDESARFAVARFRSDNGQADIDADGIADQRDACPMRFSTRPSGCSSRTLQMHARLGDRGPRRGLFVTLRSSSEGCFASGRPRVYRPRAGRDPLVPTDLNLIDEEPGVRRYFLAFHRRQSDPPFYVRTVPQLAELLGHCHAARSNPVT